MPEFLDRLGFWPLCAALFGIVFVRAQATYWIARAVATGAARGSGRLLDRPGVARASALLARFGPPIVTVSFVVVGFQTVMNAAAGAARMRWPLYLVAMLPGCAAWALVYATVGLAVFWAAVGAAAGSTSGVVVLVLLASVAAVMVVVLRTRRRRTARR